MMSTEQEEYKDVIDLGWINKYFTIKEIDDKDFRKTLFDAISRADDPRRWEIHNTDLIYCLRASWAYKILPQEFTEEGYSDIKRWMRGKGIEIGISNALLSSLPEDVVHQKKTKLGQAVGSIDVVLFEMIYEITTWIFYGSEKNPRNLPPIGKLLQTISYQVSENEKKGRIKLFVLIPFDAPDRTWEIDLTDEGLKFFSEMFIQRSLQLRASLLTGKWWLLPHAYFDWRCKNCGICDYLEEEKNKIEIGIAWLKWKKKFQELEVKE